MALPTIQAIKLADYDISPKYGFLPQSEPLSFSPIFSSLDAISTDLPKLLSARAVRTTIKNFTMTWDKNNPQITPADYHYAGRVLSFLGHAYVWEHPDKPANKIPANLAIPWYEIFQQLQRPPVLSYASYALDNWRKIDANHPIALDNIVLHQNFLGGMDEEWFILVHVAIEAQAGQLITGLSKAQDAVAHDDISHLCHALQMVANCLQGICHILARMPERCDPYVYYNRVRPYIHGWQDNPALPNGLIYEGVSAYQGKGQYFRGETGAQSAIIPCLDSALGITHSDDPLVHYLYEMRTYMPENHRRFLGALDSMKDTDGHSPIRIFISLHKKDEPALWQSFCDCVNLVAQFRSIHLEFAAQYIQRQDQSARGNPTQIGTGGTPFMRYLQKHFDETKQVIQT